jgi:hypothetical protein
VGENKSIIMKYSGNKKPRRNAGFRDERNGGVSSSVKF